MILSKSERTKLIVFISISFLFVCTNIFAAPTKLDCSGIFQFPGSGSIEALIQWEGQKTKPYFYAVEILKSQDATRRITEDELFEDQYVWNEKTKKLLPKKNYVAPPSFATNDVIPLTFKQFVRVMDELKAYRFESEEAFVRHKAARWTRAKAFKPERFAGVNLVVGVRLKDDVVYNVYLRLIDSAPNNAHVSLIQTFSEAVNMAAIAEPSSETNKNKRQYVLGRAYMDVDTGHFIVVIAKEKGADTVAYFSTTDHQTRSALQNEDARDRGLTIEDWVEKASEELYFIPVLN